MTEFIENGRAMIATPPLLWRFWRSLGFVYHLGDEPEGAEILPGWMKTDMHMHFGVVDRLRLMVSGKLFIASIVSTDTPSAMICKSRMDWRIMHPGEKWR